MTSLRALFGDPPSHSSPQSSHFDVPPPGGQGISFVLNQLKYVANGHAPLFQSNGKPVSVEAVATAFQNSITALNQALSRRSDLRELLVQAHGAHSPKIRDFLDRVLQKSGIPSSGNLREACVFALVNAISNTIEHAESSSTAHMHQCIALSAEDNALFMELTGHSGVHLNKSGIILLPGGTRLEVRRDVQGVYGADAQ